MQKNNIDKVVIGISLIYLVFPIIIFFFGFLKTFIAIPFSILLVCSFWRLYKELTKNEIKLFSKNTLKFWIIALIVLIVWIGLSGIGGFCFQNEDFWARNAILRDLVNYKWPVIYDLSMQPNYIQEYVGNTKVAFVYYYTFWMPVALLGKVLSLNEITVNIVLYIYSLIGLFFVVYMINRLNKKVSYLSLLVLVFFSGLDVIMYIYKNRYFPLSDHMEFWANNFFQYSSNTTLLFWVFNQAIPIWLITSIFLQEKENKYIPLLCAISFCFSPWATIGFVPLVIANIIKNRNIKQFFNLPNIFVCLIMIVTFGSFYLSNSAGGTEFGLIFNFLDVGVMSIIKNYLAFILFEFLLYFVVMGKKAASYDYYYVVFIELIVFPLIYSKNANFCMRATIPALFITAIYVLTFLNENGYRSVRSIILVFLLIIGSYTPFTEISRSIYNTTTNYKYRLRDEAYSFGNYKYHNETWEDAINVIKDQFYAYDYYDSFFFKYLAK